jgi:VWFA-related protein
MRRSACLAPLVLAVLVPALRADDPPVTFHSDVSLVRVDVQVLDRDNHAITGLHAEDFVLKEQGKVVEIRNFASENMPLDVLFLLDVSGSMRPHVQRIANAAHDAFRVLGDKDRIGIMVFDRYTRVRSQFRNVRDGVDREFDNLLRQERFNGGTDITRGMLDAADYVRKNARPEARRAIVILTDDETEFEREDAAVAHALARADAVMSALIAPDAMRNRPYGHGGGGGYPGGGIPGPLGGGLGGIILGGGRGGMGRGGPGMGGPMGGGPRTHSAGTSEIALQSGGDSMPVDNASALEDTLMRLRQRYALHFHAGEGVEMGQERSIDVTLSDFARRRYRDAQLKFRGHYVAGGGDPKSSEIITRRVEPDASDSAPSRRVYSDASTTSTPRRRVAISEPDSSSGPNAAVGAPATPEPAAEDPQPAPPPQAATPATPPAPATPAEPKGGWRRVPSPAATPPVAKP